MRMGIIDMGTNTFHLVIVETDGDNFKFLYRDRRSVRIGKGGINQGYITEDAMERAITTLVDFKQILDQHKVTEVQATATSAVRNAKNGKELVSLIFEETGIEAKVISGLEEAELIYFGVSQALSIGNKPALIMDIGGGSIEFIICTSDKVLWKESFEIGGQRLLDLYHRNDPISEFEIIAIKSFLEEELYALFEAVEKHKPKSLIGSSGTFDTLSDIYCHANNINRPENVTEYPLSLEGFRTLHNELITKNKAERLLIPGMIEMRVDMIVVASVLLEFLIERLKIQTLRVSAYALKEGVMLHHIKTSNQLSS